MYLIAYYKYLIFKFIKRSTKLYTIYSLKEQNNLNSFFAIVLGLGNVAVSRLSQTWEVSSKSMFSILNQ